MKKLLAELFKAYHDARKHKRNKNSQLQFELHLERNLYQLALELDQMSYKVGPSSCFIVKKPVQREIFAAEFRDRVVHHFLFNRIAPVFERKFIYDSYSCRKGKGTLFGTRRLMRHSRHCTDNFSKNAWVLKLDIQGYFMNIPRDKLYMQSVKVLKNSDALTRYLLREIIFADPTYKCIFKSNRNDWIGLPKAKSMFHTPKDCGLPIGNLTSQLFSNIYLDGFDHYIKRDLGIKHYGRYVDDFFLIHRSRELLVSITDDIDRYLKEQLSLNLHPKKKYLQPVSHGVEFLGAKVKNSAMIPGRRVCKNSRVVISQANQIARKYKGDQNVPPFVQDMINSMNSYLGIMLHLHSYGVRRKLIGKLSPELVRYVKTTPSYNKLQARYQDDTRRDTNNRKS